MKYSKIVNDREESRNLQKELKEQRRVKKVEEEYLENWRGSQPDLKKRSNG